MIVKESLVDKGLGTVGLVTGLAGCILAISSLNRLVKGPSVIWRLAGLAGIALACPVATASLYVGYLLLRYPDERRTTAKEIARLAARQKTPLTQLWADE